jgi:hypothetical protein
MIVSTSKFDVTPRLAAISPVRLGLPALSTLLAEGVVCRRRGKPVSDALRIDSERSKVVAGVLKAILLPALNLRQSCNHVLRLLAVAA